MRSSLVLGYFIHSIYKLHLESPKGLCAVVSCWVMSAATSAVSAKREWFSWLQFLWLLAFFFQPLACALPTMDSVNRVHREIQQDNWCHEQDQQYTFQNHRFYSHMWWSLFPPPPTLVFSALILDLNFQPLDSNINLFCTTLKQALLCLQSLGKCHSALPQRFSSEIIFQAEKKSCN